VRASPPTLRRRPSQTNGSTPVGAAVEMLASPGEGALSAIGPDHRLAGVAGASAAAFESDESNDRVKRDRHDERRPSRSMRKSSLRRDIPVPAAKQDLRDAAAHSRDSPEAARRSGRASTGSRRGDAPRSRARIRPDASARVQVHGAPAADETGQSRHPLSASARILCKAGVWVRPPTLGERSQEKARDGAGHGRRTPRACVAIACDRPRRTIAARRPDPASRGAPLARGPRAGLGTRRGARPVRAHARAHRHPARGTRDGVAHPSTAAAYELAARPSPVGGAPAARAWLARDAHQVPGGRSREPARCDLLDNRRRSYRRQRPRRTSGGQHFPGVSDRPRLPRQGDQARAIDPPCLRGDARGRTVVWALGRRSSFFVRGASLGWPSSSSKRNVPPSSSSPTPHAAGRDERTESRARGSHSR
jgi:hypothetical protein